jgi:two-component system response regulator NreC
MNTTRVLIADDHAVVRAGLRLLIDGQEDMEVIGEAGDGWQTVDQATSLRPDIVLLDITMPGLNGLEVASELGRRVPDVRLLVLTMHDDEAYLRQFLRAGVSGYILKKAADTELVAAVRAVARGETFIYPSLTGVLVDRFLDKPEGHQARGSGGNLTARETEVLQLVAQGYTSQQIGDLLSISVNTVQTHRAHIMEKLGLNGRAELVRYALAKGLLTSDPS